jgi:hypothetical protein
MNLDSKKAWKQLTVLKIMDEEMFCERLRQLDPKYRFLSILQMQGTGVYAPIRRIEGGKLLGCH